MKRCLEKKKEKIQKDQERGRSAVTRERGKIEVKFIIYLEK